MSYVYRFIYALPFHTTLTLLGLLYLCWHCLPKTKLGQKIKSSKAICGAAFLSWSIVMSYITVFSREQGDVMVSLVPFHQLRFVLNGGATEILRSAWMNVLLFIPGGLLLSGLMPKHWSIPKKGVLIIITLASISAGVECLQWHFQVGHVEIDDVICNSCGGFLGFFISIDHSRKL